MLVVRSAFQWGYPLFALTGGFIGRAIVIMSVYGKTESATIIVMGITVWALLNEMIVWLITLGTLYDIDIR